MWGRVCVCGRVCVGVYTTLLYKIAAINSEADFVYVNNSLV